MSLKLCQFLLVMVSVEMLMVKVSMSPARRQKRGDDGDPLNAVVEQLSQQVTSLKAQLTQQENTFNAKLNSVNTEINSLKTRTGEQICEIVGFECVCVHVFFFFFFFFFCFFA